MLYKDGEEYVFGAGIDHLFCKNHGTFLEDELNKLNAFMVKLQTAKSEKDIQELLKTVDPEYKTAFEQAQKDQKQEWYGAHTEVTSKSE